MSDIKDDQNMLLFTCERCGSWPMAYQGMRPYGGEASFTCTRCKAVAIFKVRSGASKRPHLEALAG